MKDDQPVLLGYSGPFKKFLNTAKCKIIHLGRKNAGHSYRIGEYRMVTEKKLVDK